MNKPSYRTLLLLLILLLALALRLWLWSRPEHPLANDETEYLPVAQDLVGGRGFVFYDSYRWLRAPLYPLFLATCLFLGGGQVRVATFIQVLLSTATVYGFYLLARRLFPETWSERAGLVAALLAALLLPFATFPALFMAETLFTFLLVAFFLTILHVPAATPARRWRWAAAAGLLLGLCALTRAVALAFLPLAAGWLFAAQGKRAANGPEGHVLLGRAGRDGWALAGRIGRALLLPLLLAAVGLATIAPWTIRNAIVYHRFIPLDTGAAYSLWAYYDGGPAEDIEEINRALEAVPNPADRQAYALAQWQERLREDPGGMLRKVPRAFPYLLRLKPIEDRFLPLPYREPEFLYFVLALLLDDGLYALIAVASLLALLFLPTDRGKTLALLWLFYNVAVMMVLHAEARYRQLLFPALIPLAAAALVQGRCLFAGRRRELAWRSAAAALLLAGWGYCFVAFSPWEWTATNLCRGFLQFAGQVHRTLGRSEEALESFRRAIEADPRNPDPYYDLGRALEGLGRSEEAAEVYRWCWDRRSNYLPCSASLGNLLRHAGRYEEARAAFRGRWVDEGAVLAWSWDHLDVAPLDYLDVGNGLDFGYLAGLHAGEEGGGVTYRWTTGEARLRLVPTRAADVRLRLRLAGPRLGPAAAPVSVDVWVDGRLLAHWEVGPFWEVDETPTFPVRQGRPVEIVLRSGTFVPQRVEPTSSDTRTLGVQLDWAGLFSEDGTPQQVAQGGWSPLFVRQHTCIFRHSEYNRSTPFP